MSYVSLVNLFQEYDRAFDMVCDELLIENRPSWRDRWFYRFLRINPVPYLFKQIESNNSAVSFEKKYLEVAKKHGILNSRSMSRLRFFIEYQNLPFHKWWYLHALPTLKESRFSFEKVKLDPMFYVIPREIMSTEELEDNYFYQWVAENKDSLNKIRSFIDYGNYVLYVVPKYGDESKIKNDIRLNMKSDFQVDRHIVASKMPERTVVDIFKIFEYKAHTGEIDLLVVAENSDALKFSRSVSGSDSFDSSDSVKSGISRLYSLGKVLIRNTSYGRFPTTSMILDDQHESGVNYIIENYFDFDPLSLFENLKASHLYSYHEFFSIIKNDLIDLKNSGISLY